MSLGMRRVNRTRLHASRRSSASGLRSSTGALQLRHTIRALLCVFEPFAGVHDVAAEVLGAQQGRGPQVLGHLAVTGPGLLTPVTHELHVAQLVARADQLGYVAAQLLARLEAASELRIEPGHEGLGHLARS